MSETPLVEELSFLPTFVLGTLHGEPLPLADFTRQRIADAVTAAATEITRLEAELTTARRDALNEALTIARVAAKLNPTWCGRPNAVAVSVMAAIHAIADPPPSPSSSAASMPEAISKTARNRRAFGVTARRDAVHESAPHLRDVLPGGGDIVNAPESTKSGAPS